jgi:hypothetical protein
MESLRPHYARTLWHWVERLGAHRDQVRALRGEISYLARLYGRFRLCVRAQLGLGLSDRGGTAIAKWCGALPFGTRADLRILVPAQPAG